MSSDYVVGCYDVTLTSCVVWLPFILLGFFALALRLWLAMRLVPVVVIDARAYLIRLAGDHDSLRDD